ncbi:MAG: hypothetical protein FVQ79_13370 [Planctomycetes bacterium]|nr:hypothetical protein [Planctomycetota bacterium]
MTGAEVLSVIIQRLGTNCGITSINRELQSVLYDISSRADFLTAISQVVTSEGTAEYDEPADLKQVYECFVVASASLEEKTYRHFLAYMAEDGSAGRPTMFARRHDKLYFWPVPDGVYSVSVDHARHHPETWTDVLFGVEFDEAIFEGVLAALYKGQLFEKLRLNGKKVSNRDIAESVTETLDGTTDTDKDGTTDDVTVTVDDDATASVSTDDDSDVLAYEFSKDFPEIALHEKLYEAELAKLIVNMETEIIHVEYRDI